MDSSCRLCQSATLRTRPKPNSSFHVHCKKDEEDRIMSAQSNRMTLTFSSAAILAILCGGNAFCQSATSASPATECIAARGALSFPPTQLSRQPTRELGVLGRYGEPTSERVQPTSLRRVFVEHARLHRLQRLWSRFLQSEPVYVHSYERFWRPRFALFGLRGRWATDSRLALSDGLCSRSLRASAICQHGSQLAPC